MAILVLPRTLDASIKGLPQVTAPDVQRMARLGVKSIRDLLMYLPFGWETYGSPTGVETLRPGQQATVVGTIASISAKQSLRRRIKLTEATIRDDGGVTLSLVWFNQPFVARQLHRGDRIAVAGTVKSSRYGGRLHIQNPHYERLED